MDNSTTNIIWGHNSLYLTQSILSTHYLKDLISHKNPQVLSKRKSLRSQIVIILSLRSIKRITKTEFKDKNHSAKFLKI
jgi:hypothetical protein